MKRSVPLVISAMCGGLVGLGCLGGIYTVVAGVAALGLIVWAWVLS